MHHHGTAIRRCRPDPILLLAPLAERLERPPATQRYDACMCMGSNPGQPGKNLSKMISQNQVKFELSTLRLDLYPFAGTAGKVVEFSLRMPAVLGSSPVVTGQKFLN